MDHIFLKVFVRNDLTVETTESLETINICSAFLSIHRLVFQMKFNYHSLIFLESPRQYAVIISFTAKIR